MDYFAEFEFVLFVFGCRLVLLLLFLTLGYHILDEFLFLCRRNFHFDFVALFPLTHRLVFPRLSHLLLQFVLGPFFQFDFAGFLVSNHFDSVFCFELRLLNRFSRYPIHATYVVFVLFVLISLYRWQLFAVSIRSFRLLLVVFCMQSRSEFRLFSLTVAKNGFIYLVCLPHPSVSSI